MTTAPPTPAPAKSNRAMTSLVLGILGIICCGLLAPIAWYMGSQELKAIRAGTALAANETTAKAGMILGIIGSIILVLTLLWVFLWGGMAVIGGMTGGMN